MKNLISNHWNIVRNRFYDPENPLKEVSFMILAILVLSYVPFKNQFFGNFGQKLQLKISFRALAHVFLITFWTHVQKPVDYLQSARLDLFVRLQPVQLVTPLRRPLIKNKGNFKVKIQCLFYLTAAFVSPVQMSLSMTQYVLWG